MNFSLQRFQELRLIKIQNLVAALDQNQLVQAFQAELEAGAKDFILDLSQNDYISSMGLSCLVSLLTRARNLGGEVLLMGLSHKVNELLIITRLRNSFVICEDLDQALAYFAIAQP